MDERLKQIQSDVDEMNKTFEREESQQVTESVVTDSISTDPPTIESASTNAPTTDAPELDERDQIIADLRSKLEEKEAKKTTDTPTTDVPLTLEEQNFLDGIDFDEAMSSPESFNKLLNAVYQKGVKQSKDISTESVLRNIPEIVKANILTVTSLQRAAENFYSNNEDLRPYSKTVATVWEELYAQNPDKTYEDLMNDAATETRKRLNLQKEVKQQQKEEKKPPRLPSNRGKVGRQSEQPNLTPMEQEIAEMNKTIGR